MSKPKLNSTDSSIKQSLRLDYILTCRSDKQWQLAYKQWQLHTNSTIDGDMCVQLYYNRLSLILAR